MKNGKPTKSPDLKQIRHDLADAGRNLWLAGVGVVAQVEEEGRELFDTLVERGRKVETRQFKALDRTVARTSERVRELSERIEERVEEGARGVLHRLGLPTRDDFEALSGRVQALAQKLDRVAAAAHATPAE
jgi:poly(hydroxyalkanoate) granule-associated protein